MAGNRTQQHAQAEVVLLQKRVAELQSRLDSERADAKAASAALQTAQGHIRSLEQAGDGLQKQRAAAEEQVQRLQKELANSKVQILPVLFYYATPKRTLFLCGRLSSCTVPHAAHCPPLTGVHSLCSLLICLSCKAMLVLNIETAPSIQHLL